MSITKTLRYSFSLILFLGCVMPALGQTPGAEDSSFNIGTLRQNGRSHGLGTQPDGKVLYVTGAGFGEFGVSRYLANGQIDTTFGNGGTASVDVSGRGGTAASHVLVDPLGRIYLYGGYFYQYSSPDSHRTEIGTAITRFLANGAVDTSFGTGGVIRQMSYHETNPSNPSSPPITRVEGIPGMGHIVQSGLLPDGKLLVVGTTSSASSLAMARFNENGRLDASFGGTGIRTVDLGEPLSITVMKIDHDGSLVMLGRSASSDEVVLKLTAQATLNTSFGSAGKVRLRNNSSYQYSLSDLEIQPDGMILVGGSRMPVPSGQTQPDGSSSESILARLTAGGAPDTSFGSGGLSALNLPDRDGVYALALEPNGKILAAGTATANATDGSLTRRPFLVRMLQNGQVDTSFQQQILETEAQTSDVAVNDGAYLLLSSTFDTQLRKFFIDPAPRAGSVNTGQTPSVTGFNVDALNAAGMPVDSATTAHVLGLHGYIYTQTADLGANADVFVVASTARGWYMRTTAGYFVAWSGRVSDLVPAYENVQLTERTHVPIYGGALPFTGPYAIYIGYMREGGPLVYIDEPSVLQITE
jgi:uncharacterized delta-60 repeat protein